MSRPMSKTAKRALIALAIVALLGACFASVGVYAHYTFNKPKFPKPDGTLQSASALPETKEAVFDYVSSLYEKAVSADDVEGSWHTDVKLKDYDTPLSAPFSDADKTLIAYVIEHANDDDLLKNAYPKQEKVLQCKEKGVFLPEITAENVPDYTAERGRYNDDGDYVDDNYYFITLEVDPATVDPAAVTESETFKNITGMLTAAFTVEDAELTPQRVQYKYKVFRPLDQLVSLEITRTYQVRATLLPDEVFAPLITDGGKTAAVELPYESTEKISFKHYGAYFTQSSIVRNPGDMDALPASVTVGDDTAPEDFTLTFTPSADGLVEIDSDGVMTVKGVQEDPLTVTMTLVYGGHTYTDTLTVYLTELEVESDAQ